jgi:NADPH-dependent curcumin reductase CurA
MPETTMQRILLAARPLGSPQTSNFRLEKIAMPAIPSGGVLLRVLYLSLDPYMRGRMDDVKSYASPIAIGDVMPGRSVAEVIASEHPDYRIGDLVVALTGWSTHAASTVQGLRKLEPTLVPITAALGALGMPGFTAYVGLTLIGIK